MQVRVVSRSRASHHRRRGHERFTSVDNGSERPRVRPSSAERSERKPLYAVGGDDAPEMCGSRRRVRVMKPTHAPTIFSYFDPSPSGSCSPVNSRETDRRHSQPRNRYGGKFHHRLLSADWIRCWNRCDTCEVGHLSRLLESLIPARRLLVVELRRSATRLGFVRIETPSISRFHNPSSRSFGALGR